MDVAATPKAVAALAAFVRQRLTDAAETLVPFLVHRDEPEVLPALARHGKAEVAAAARQLAMVIAGAAAPFAPTPQARMRLLRQMVASGLLTEREHHDAAKVLSAAQ